MKRGKSKVLIISLAVVLATICAGGSLAYFTAEKTAHNVISSGSVEIEMYEWADEGKSEPFPEDGVSGVMPGASVTKIVEVKNTGTGEAWVRIKVTKEVKSEDGEDYSDTDNLITEDIDTENWTLADGWYYYNKALEPGKTTEPLFTAVSFNEDMGNDFQSSTITLDLEAQAVQTANNGSSGTTATGWPAE